MEFVTKLHRRHRDGGELHLEVARFLADPTHQHALEVWCALWAEHNALGHALNDSVSLRMEVAVSAASSHAGSLGTLSYFHDTVEALRRDSK
jgi:hypothetical protein